MNEIAEATAKLKEVLSNPHQTRMMIAAVRIGESQLHDMLVTASRTNPAVPDLVFELRLLLLRAHKTMLASR